MHHQDVKKFLWKLCILGAPLGFALLFSSWILFTSGELMNMDAMVQKQVQNSGTTIVGLAYSNPYKFFKIKSAISKNPHILALGNSKIMELREKFFRKNLKFYNASNSIYGTKDLVTFLDHLPNPPKIILVAVDYWFFHPSNQNAAFQSDASANKDRVSVWKYGIIEAWKDYLAGKFSIRGLLTFQQNEKIGIQAIARNSGFRGDGSYAYGDTLPDEASWKFQLEGTILQVHQGHGTFPHGNTIAEDAIRSAQEFLEKAKSKGIHVIGFLPPLHHEVLEKMRSLDEKYVYYFGLQQRLQPIFEHYGFRFYDYSDPRTLGAPDSEMIDTIHASEKLFVRMLIDLSEHEQALAAYLDVPFLQALLEKSKDRFSVAL